MVIRVKKCFEYDCDYLVVQIGENSHQVGKVGMYEFKLTFDSFLCDNSVYFFFLLQCSTDNLKYGNRVGFFFFILVTIRDVNGRRRRKLTIQLWVCTVLLSQHLDYQIH